jgi:NAD(P)H-flavin reductase
MYAFSMLMAGLLLTSLSRLRLARADSYLNNPRGSNNKLSEQNNNANNQQRLFDSQNNANAGYQVGDNCNPVCQDANRDYDETKAGAMQGVMTYYQGSELYIEWHLQHSCGYGAGTFRSSGSTNTECMVILQYMTDKDNPGLRDGTKRGNNQQNTAGGQNEPPTTDDANDPTLGQHESVQYYKQCKVRDRNRGLYTADQDVQNDQGSTATRQNPNGNQNAQDRNGLECPEERDYYPYWEPNPWHDIVVFTSEPEKRCEYYRQNSQNKEMFNEEPPDCQGGIPSRDNHNGNVNNGEPMYYSWKIPDYIEGKAVIRMRYNMSSGDFERGSDVNARNNFEEKIGDAFFVDSQFNDPNPENRRRSPVGFGLTVLSQDPRYDYVGMGDAKPLQLQVNTNQYARTFQDRTHMFKVNKRPEGVPGTSRIVNLNVRGRRGNIVQVYPSVEYDFVPTELVVNQDDFIHFQWVGSDANPKNNEGNGRQGTDRSNLVQVRNRRENVPMEMTETTLFYDFPADKKRRLAEEEGHKDWRSRLAALYYNFADRFGDKTRRLQEVQEKEDLIRRLAYLNQQDANCDQNENNDQETDNCAQLNGASAYFDGGVVQMNQVGEHHIMSTRNNDFSNRSQKASITVLGHRLEWYWVSLIVIGAVIVAAFIVYGFIAWWALRHPTSIFFSQRFRPRILNFEFRGYRIARADTIQKAIEARRAYQLQVATDYRLKARQDAGVKPPTLIGAERKGQGASGADRVTPVKTEGEDDVMFTENDDGEYVETNRVERDELPNWGQKPNYRKRGMRCARRCGLEEVRLFFLVYFLLNIIMFFIGFIGNYNEGFRKHWGYRVAKGGGAMLNMDLAVLTLPMLKSLQTMVASVGATREWLPIDDPWHIHMVVAFFIFVATVIHVVGHVAHVIAVATAPVLHRDTLLLYQLEPEWEKSGMNWWDQFWDTSIRCAPVTGVILLIHMGIIYVTSFGTCRRGCNCKFRGKGRACGGFDLFWKVHGSWPWVYVVTLIHAPFRFWIWIFFPVVLHIVNRSARSSGRKYFAALKHAAVLPNDVLHLRIELPKGFSYQAGQFLHIYWKGEWHPFTISSAPEEEDLTVHIKSDDGKDWCSALRRNLTEVLPDKSAGKGKMDKRPTAAAKVGTVVKYTKGVSPSGHRFFSQPVRLMYDEGLLQVIGSTPKGSPKTSPREGGAVDPENVVLEENGRERASTDVSGNTERTLGKTTSFYSDNGELLPEDAADLRISGPHGAPAQKVWFFDTIVLVGSGIGVTPFAAILRSAQLRAQQRHDILSRSSKVFNERLLDRTIPLPRRIHFYWIVRSEEEIAWLYDMFEQAVRGPAGKSISVDVYITRGKSSGRSLDCAHTQHKGVRPNWDEVFDSLAARSKGHHVGVFLCGSPMIGKELRKRCRLYSDESSDRPTRFAFFAESF